MNGRISNDVGKFTFCNEIGRSTIIYFLSFPQKFSLVKKIDVLQFNEFSDHAPVLCSFQFDSTEPDIEYKRSHSYIQWNSYKENIYVDAINEVIPNLIDLVKYLGTSKDVDQCVNNLY